MMRPLRTVRDDEKDTLPTAHRAFFRRLLAEASFTLVSAGTMQAGAPRHQGARGIWSTNTAIRPAERELALQAQRAYERTVKDRQQNAGASATAGRASHGSSREHVAQ